MTEIIVSGIEVHLAPLSTGYLSLEHNSCTLCESFFISRMEKITISLLPWELYKILSLMCLKYFFTLSRGSKMLDILLIPLFNIVIFV